METTVAGTSCMNKDRLYRIFQTISVNLLVLGALILSGMFVTSLLPFDRPAKLRDQQLKIVSVSTTQAVLAHDSTIVVSTPYKATVVWTMKCGEEEQFDMGHKIQTREPGVYIQKNTIIVPVTAIGKECTYHTTFTWKPPWSLWERTIENGVIYLKVMPDGRLFYHIELPKKI